MLAKSLCFEKKKITHHVTSDNLMFSDSIYDLLKQEIYSASFKIILNVNW